MISDPSYWSFSISKGRGLVVSLTPMGLKNGDARPGLSTMMFATVRISGTIRCAVN